MEASNGQSSRDWRSNARGFLEKLKYILVHKIMADLTIRLVNNGQIDMEFNVHSFLFIMGSEVFEKMINSTFKEGVSRVIEIKDRDPEIFEVLINFFYGQPLDLKKLTNLKQLQDLTDIADYYMIHGLKDEIAKYCESLDTTQAACWGLMFAEKCNAPKLKDLKLKHIVSHTEEVVEQAEFLSLPEEAVRLILEQDFLTIKEFDLFKAVEAWIKRNVDKCGKQIIDSLIPKVRYLSMTREEFTSGPAMSNLIKPEDLVALLCNFNLKDCTPFPSGFSQLKRKCYNSVEKIHLPKCYNSGDIELNFERVDAYIDRSFFGIKANKALTIEGFHIITLNGNPTDSYDEDVVIRAGFPLDYVSIVGKFRGKTHFSTSVFVQLDEILEISEGTTYWVGVEVKNRGLRKVINLDNSLDVLDLFNPFTFIKYPHAKFFSLAMSIKTATI